MMLLLASVVLGIVPMCLYALVIWRIDRWEKEPLSLIIAAFLWGAIPSIVFSIIAQVIAGIPMAMSDDADQLSAALYQASIVAPLTEEFIKALGLVGLFIFFRREIDSVLDGLIYGSMIGFGFSAVEDVLYFLSSPDLGSLLFLSFLRTILFGLLHSFFTGLVGVGLALGLFADKLWQKILFPAVGFALAVVTHSLHNFFATIGNETALFAILGAGVGFLWFITTIIVCLHHENRWIRIQLSEEVDQGTLYAEQALDTASFWKRSWFNHGSRNFAEARTRRKLFHEATELAYKKQQQIRRPTHSARLNEQIETLRTSVREMSRSDPWVISGRIEPGKKLPPPLPPTRRKPPPLPA